MPTTDLQQPVYRLSRRLDSSTMAIAICLLLGLGLTTYTYRHFVAEDAERLAERMQRGTQTLAIWSAMNPAPAGYLRTLQQLTALQQAVLDGTPPTPELLSSHSWPLRAQASEYGALRYLPRVQPAPAGPGLLMLDYRGQQQPFPHEVSDYLQSGPSPPLPAPEYFPILFQTAKPGSLDWNREGVSHFADPQFHLLMDQARDGGLIATRSAFPLLTKTQPYVVTYAFIALYTPGPPPASIAERRERHTGFINSVSYTPADGFINLIPESYLGFETAFIPHNEAWEADAMDTTARAILDSGNFVREEFGRSDGRIHIIARPSPELTATMQTPQRWWALSIGLVLTLWVCSLLVMSRLRSRRLAGLVEQRTQDLAERSQRLSDSERRYRMLADNVQDVIFTLDRAGLCTYISPSITQQSGLVPETYLGKPVIDDFTPESAVAYRKAMATLLADAASQTDTPASVTFEVQRLRPDGRRKTIETTLSLIRDPQSGETGFLGVSRDITERKRHEAERVELEAAFHQSQKLEAIGTLAGGIAHDFNNLLTGILGHAELLKAHNGSAAENAASVQVIETAALRARELTSQLLGYARKGHYQSLDVNLQDMLDETIRLTARTLSKNIRIECDVPPEPLYVRGDPAQINQALLNLVVNARDAMPQGGTLHISLRETVLDSALQLNQHELLQPGRYCEIALRDTGSGILAEHLPRIFDPFFTDKPKGQGTGLGLAMVHGVTRNHGGGVSVLSTPGQGATFTIYLPLCEAPRTQGSASVPAAAPPTVCQGHVLLIDDEALIRELGSVLLGKLGYSVALAEDGRSGLEHYRLQRDRIDLVIVDMNMPNMGGPECVRHLVALDPTVRIIIATGFSQHDMGDLLGIPNVCGFLQKPFMQQELCALLQRCRS